MQDQVLLALAELKRDYLDKKISVKVFKSKSKTIRSDYVKEVVRL